MRTKVLWLFAAALVVTSLVVGPAASAKPSRSAAGTVVIGHDQEPATLNNLITPGNAYTTSLVTNLVLGSGEIYNQNATLVPQLFTGQAEAGQVEAAHGSLHDQGRPRSGAMAAR